MTKIIHTTASDFTSSNHMLEPDEDLMVAEALAVAESLNLTTIGRRFSNSAASGKETISITIHSVGRGRFAAYLGTRILCVSETPLLSAARVLQTAGVPAPTRLEMVHKGLAKIAMRTTVGAASGLRVSETRSMPRFVPWRPDQLPRTGPTACTVEGVGGKAAPSRPQTLPTKERVSKALLQQAYATYRFKWLR